MRRIHEGGGSQRSTFPLRIASDLFHFGDTFRNHSSRRFIRDLFDENEYSLGSVLLREVKSVCRGNAKSHGASIERADRAFVRVANEN